MAHDIAEQGVSHATGGTAFLVAGEVAVQIPAVAQVARAAAKAIQIDDGHTDHGTGQLVRLQLVHEPAHHLDAVQFIAMNGCSQTQPRPGLVAMGHQHRHRGGNGGERLIRGPVQGGKAARFHLPSQQG